MTTPPSLAERIDAAIRQNMLIGLQDAELYDAPGRERIGEWVDWIAQRVAETVQPELDRQAAENQRLTTELETAQADACAYRYLADGISDTMADQNEWDGDDAEEEILLRYVRHLAVNQRPEAAR